VKHSDLAVVIDAWPDLRDAIRTAILVMAKAPSAQAREGERS